jgi:hypothetical protein
MSVASVPDRLPPKGSETHEQKGDSVTPHSSIEETGPTNPPARRTPTAWPRRAGVLAAIAVTAAIGLAACGGRSDTPHVANLGTSTTLGSSPASSGDTGSTSTAPSESNPTELLDEWAACMRAHGDPGQPDPTIDVNKVIHLTWNESIPGGIYGTNKGGQGNAGPGQYCRTYIDQAQTDLQGGQHQSQPSQAQLLKFSQCMRANGVPDFPDPSNGGLSLNRAAGGDLNPRRPEFQNASRLCAQKTGVPGFATGGSPPPGSVEFNGDNTGGAGG